MANKEAMNIHRNEPLDPRQAEADRQRAESWHKSCKPKDGGGDG